MRAKLTEKGFIHDGNVIQGSYTFTNIKEMGDTQIHTVYSAIMKSPLTIPCLVTIYDDKICISATDGNNIVIGY